MNNQKQNYNNDWGNYIDIEQGQPLYGDNVIYLEQVTRTNTKETIYNHTSGRNVFYRATQQETRTREIRQRETRKQETVPMTAHVKPVPMTESMAEPDQKPDQKPDQDPILIKIVFCALMVLCMTIE